MLSSLTISALGNFVDGVSRVQQHCTWLRWLSTFLASSACASKMTSQTGQENYFSTHISAHRQHEIDIVIVIYIFSLALCPSAALATSPPKWTESLSSILSASLDDWLGHEYSSTWNSQICSIVVFVLNHWYTRKNRVFALPLANCNLAHIVRVHLSPARETCMRLIILAMGPGAMRHHTTLLL